MRCFIAIDLPEHVKAKVFHTFETLQSKGLFKGKFVEKENLHLTLKFFGSISKEKLEEIKKKLSDIKFEKLSCDIRKAGVFDENYVKVLWVDLACDKIKELQKQISDKFPDFPEHREFSSHITTARVKFVPDRVKLLEEIEKIHFKKLDFGVGEFFLMKSELTPQGSVYKVLERYSLS